MPGKVDRDDNRLSTMNGRDLPRPGKPDRAEDGQGMEMKDIEIHPVQNHPRPQWIAGDNNLILTGIDVAVASPMIVNIAEIKCIVDLLDMVEDFQEVVTTTAGTHINSTGENADSGFTTVLWHFLRCITHVEEFFKPGLQLQGMMVSCSHRSGRDTNSGLKINP